MGLCYAVVSGKGGVGKSILAANLGAVLASNARVLLMDTDIGLRCQDALLSMENRVVYDLVDLIRGVCSPSEAILPCEAIPSLDLLSAAQFERAKALNPKKLSMLLQSLKADYDFILIDCPAGVERGLRNVLNAGFDQAILVVTPDDIAIRSAEKTAALTEEKTAIRPQLIVNRLDGNLIRRGEMMTASTISSLMDLPLLGAVPEDEVVRRAMLRHTLFIQYDCEARSALLRIAARVMGRSIPVFEYGGKKDRHARALFVRGRFSGKMKEATMLDDH